MLGVFSAESLTSHTDFRGGGNDFIIGSSGDDLVLAGAGNDQAWLGRGNDILLSGLGNDVADGGQGSDLMAGGAGNDRLSGSNGSDVLAGNAGDDTLDGGQGNDALIDGLGSDTLFGRAGDDLFFATQAQLLGGSGTDTDHFDGGAGFDTLALLLDPTTFDVEQDAVAATFVPGQDRSRSAAWISRSRGLSGSCSRPSSASTTCRCPAASLASGCTRPTCSVWFRRAPCG